MNEEKAREILKDNIKNDSGLYGAWDYIDWTPGDSKIILDGSFTVADLEAMAWWMKNNPYP